MIGLSKLGSALTVVFSVSLVAIVAQIFCVLWRRRRRRQRSFAGGENSINNSSKELFYFCCWKKQSRIEPHEAPSPSTPPRRVAMAEIDDLLKLQGLYMYGPSRILFTIQEEEEREGVDSENCPSLEKGEEKSKSVDTKEHLGVSSSLPLVAVTIDVDEATPFATPCASPPYYTPLPSPTREIDGVSGNDKVLYVSVDVKDAV